MKSSLLGLVAAAAAISVAPSAMAKSIVYNGIECAAATNQTWLPSTLGLHGTNPGSAYCPVLVAPSEGYTFSALSYAVINGVNLNNPRLCRRTDNGAITCGATAAGAPGFWILYRPAGTGTYDDLFVWVNVGNGASLIREYTVIWTD